MITSRPEKLDYDELVKSSTMFFIDTEYEDAIEKEVEKTSLELVTKLTQINSTEGLKNYICSDKNSLENILCLINISSEKFKRVITMLRLEKGHVFLTEWSMSKLREMMIANSIYMDEVCELLLVGYTSEKYRKLIPKFYLEYFRIDISTIARLADPDDLRRLVKRGIEGKYNNGIGDRLYSFVQQEVERICNKEGLTFACKKYVPFLQRTVDFALPNEINPKIIIDVSYNVTTSSTQTKKRVQIENTSHIIRAINEDTSSKIINVSFIDGAGWVGRQSDLGAIHRCSDFCINIKNIGVLSEIIRFQFGNI